MALTLLTPPTAEPIGLPEAKLHLKLDDLTEDDPLITGLIVAAREYVETLLWRQLVTATWLLTRDYFVAPRYPQRSPVIELRLPPIQSVEIEYVDPEGIPRTLDPTDYQADLTSAPARLLPLPGDTWPETQAGRVNAVEIRFTAGYGNPADVPEGIKRYMLARISHCYFHRGDTAARLPDYVDGQLDPFRWRGPALGVF